MRCEVVGGYCPRRRGLERWVGWESVLRLYSTITLSLFYP